MTRFLSQPFSSTALWSGLRVLGLCALAAPAPAQRHLPATQIFASPGLILIDTTVESPPVNSASRSLPVPLPGRPVEFQIFAPDAAGLDVFQFALSLGAPESPPVPIRIVSVVDWSGRRIPGRKGSFFQDTLAGPISLPLTGYVATVTIEATNPFDAALPLDIGLSVTTVSNPPRRVHQIEARQTLSWL